MSPELCDRVMLEMSIAHDERRSIPAELMAHVQECPACSDFAGRLGEIEELLGSGDYSQTPDLVPAVIDRVSRPRRQWWAVAAVALVGMVVGALVGGVGTRGNIGQAEDLSMLFHTAGTDLDGLSAELLVVERGLHPDVPERVYTGSIDYVAPEQIAIWLVDTTDYPDPAWIGNDVSLVISNGDTVAHAGSPCPVAALPDCLVSPSSRAVSDQPPFDDGVLLPLEIVGPGRSLTWASAIEVLGTTDLGGLPAIQVRSTVAAVNLLGAITGHGAWRDLHPTDQVLMWLHEETLVPVRVEVFATDSPERELWQLRHGYRDDLADETPIFIVELTNLVTEPGSVEIDMPEDSPSRGFVDAGVDIPNPDLPAGFETHRSGYWHLGDGGRVELASWSDGRSWVMIQVTRDWGEPRLFGLSVPFVESVSLGEGSIGYLSPSGDALAIHGDGLDVFVTGSASREMLVTTAASLGVRGRTVPPDWQEASTVEMDALPTGTLTPVVEGWSVLARVEGATTTILLSGGGSRNVIVTQTPGARLEPPIGPDYSEVEVRGTDGRYNASEVTLEWVEDGQVIRMRSETVGLAELIDVASSMESR